MLNVPPTLEGKVHPIDSLRLREFGEYLHNAFDKNFVKDGEGVKKIEAGESVTYKVNCGSKVNCVMLQENIAKGQRVEKFRVELLINGQWMTVGRGTTIGYKRLLRFSATAAEEIRVTVEECRRTSEILQVGLFYCPELGANSSSVKEYFSSSAWQTPGNDGKKIFDNDVETIWKSKSMQPLIIDLTETKSVKGFSYVPANNVNGEGTIIKYRIYTSIDGNLWEQDGGDREFENIRNNPIAQNVRFEKERNLRYLKIEPIETNDNNGTYTVAEFGVILSAL